MKSRFLKKIYIDVIYQFIFRFFHLERQRKDICFNPNANISDFSDSWNRIALDYSEKRRTINGLLLNSVLNDDLSKIQMKSYFENEIKVNISDSTDEWNRIALEYARSCKASANNGKRKG